MSAPDRAAMVAAIRALADFVETRTDLPVPTSVYAQHSLTRLDPANEDVVRDAAAKLGVEPNITADSAAARFELSHYPVRVDYVVHGFVVGRDAEGGAR